MVTPKPPVVLFVDDEPLILKMGCLDLAEAGFQVIPAASGDEAFALIESRGDIEILFSDITMPGRLDGLALAHLVHRRWPGVAILLASGMLTPAAEELPPGTAFLAKPYPFDAMMAQLTALLAARPRSGAGTSAGDGDL